MTDPMPTIIDTLHGAAEIHKAEVTGRAGIPTVLPHAWALVTRWPLSGADEFGAECDFWHGPVLADTDLLITIEVYGEPMTFQRTKRIEVKYGLAVAS